MLIRILMTTTLLFLLGGLIMLLTRFVRYENIDPNRSEWRKYIVYFIIIQSMIMLIFCGFEFFAALIAGVAVLAIIEFIQVLARNNLRILRYAVFYGIFILSGFGHIFVIQRSNGSGALAFLLIITASTDSFSQLWGKALGRNKLCPRLSPNKTREGMFGGLISTQLIAILFAFLIPGFGTWRILIVTAVLTAAAFAGDLVFSFFKRRLKIKDFSNLIPGHGGVMDRFDSLVLTLPAFYWCVRFLTI